jgi:MoaA/NifB/PqqE/SkfB family radical SAM enzyme
MKNKIIVKLRLLKEIIIDLLHLIIFYPNGIIRYIKNYKKYDLIGDRISIDSSTICQLNCPICCTGKGDLKNNIIGKGYLKFKLFKKIVDNNPTIKNIELANRGESFLNPEINKIINYGFKNKVNLTLDTGTNLNLITDDTINILIKNKFKRLVISIDGTTNEVYKKYRINGSFEKVIKNINKINYYKKKYNSKYPKLIWQFIVFKHNIHQLKTAKIMAKNLNMKFKIRLSYQKEKWKGKNKKYIRNKHGLLPCSQLFFSPQINWDGALLGCCNNRFDNYGNVFKTSLKECLQSKKYKNLKKMILGRTKNKKELFCNKCNSYYRNIL